jgi:peptidoglycan/xylan/chitin deacetylase (PgdA/CDA1 family)
VTFDDGTVDLVDEALPVLVEHRVPATVYVATAFVEEGRPFPGDGQPVSWAGLAEAASTGLVTVGSHTHHHALLDRVGATEVAKELDRSIGLIGERLGVAPRHFAYPKAVPGHAGAQAEVQARFASAALAGTRPNVPGRADPYRLARSPIQVDDGLRYFAAKAAGGMTLEDTLRRAANRLRYATVQA